jgi:hypothetical protein
MNEDDAYLDRYGDYAKGACPGEEVVLLDDNDDTFNNNLPRRLQTNNPLRRTNP